MHAECLWLAALLVSQIPPAAADEPTAGRSLPPGVQFLSPMDGGGLRQPMTGPPMSRQPMAGQPMAGQPMTGQPMSRESSRATRDRGSLSGSALPAAALPGTSLPPTGGARISDSDPRSRTVPVAPAPIRSFGAGDRDDIDRRKVDATPLVVQRLIEQIWQAPIPSQLQTRPVRLREVLEQGQAVADPRAAVQAYWAACEAVGNYYFALERQQWSRRIADPQALASDASLVAIQASRAADTEERLLALKEALLRLQQVAPGDSQQRLPWPADPPYAGRYDTNFDSMFAGGSAPANLRHLHLTMDDRQSLVIRRAEAVQAAEGWRSQWGEAYRQGRATGNSLLAAQQGLAREEAHFLRNLRQYNAAISEYALSVASPAEGLDVLLSTLIPTTLTAQRAARAAGLRTADGAALRSNSGIFRDVTPLRR